MDFAYVDELAKENNGVKNLLVPQELFDRTVDAKVIKTRNSKEKVFVFLTMIKKGSTQKNLGWQGNRLCWRV